MGCYHGGRSELKHTMPHHRTDSTAHIIIHVFQWLESEALGYSEQIIQLEEHKSLRHLKTSQIWGPLGCLRESCPFVRVRGFEGFNLFFPSGTKCSLLVEIRQIGLKVQEMAWRCGEEKSFEPSVCECCQAMLLRRCWTLHSSLAALSLDVSLLDNNSKSCGNVREACSSIPDIWQVFKKHWFPSLPLDHLYFSICPIAPLDSGKREINGTLDSF